MPYPDIEKLLVSYFTATTTHRTVTELPSNVEQIVPIIQVSRVPSGAGYRLDRPLVDVSVWTLKTQREACSALARQIAELTEKDLPGPRRTHGVVTAAGVDVAPYWLPDPNPNLCRYLATYRLAAHI